MVKHRPDIALIVEDFRVSIDRGMGFAAKSLRQSLSAMTFVTSLTLLLPPSTPPTIFTAVRLPELLAFSTNLPHKVLTEFLRAHVASLAFLDIGRCGRSVKCGLATVDLGGLLEMDCPLECVPTLAVAQLETARFEIRSETPKLNAASLLAAFPVQQSLIVLTLDILENDHNIVATVSRIAPGLRNLKLIVKSKETVCNDYYSPPSAVLTLHPFSRLCFSPLLPGGMLRPGRRTSNCSIWKTSLFMHPSLWFLRPAASNKKNNLS